MPFQDPTESLDLGNSGTGARLLVGFLSGLGINATITGDKSLSSRPMKRIVEPLTKMGFELNSNNHRLPIEITQSIGSSFFEYNSPISSAQVKSSILLAALTGSIETKITEPIGSRDHTERMLKYFGADIHSEIKNEKNIIHFSPSDLSIQDENYYVVGDFSSAAFLIVAALIAEDSEIMIRDVGINPTRAALINVLKEMGGHIELTEAKKVFNHQYVNHVQGDVKHVFKLTYPYNIIVPKGYSIRQIPMFYDYNPEWHLAYGIFEADKMPEISVQLLYTSEDNEVVIKAGTPLGYYVPFKREKFSMEIGDYNEYRTKILEGWHRGVTAFKNSSRKLSVYNRQKRPTI